MHAWQSMDTAPKDGSQILVWHSHESDPYFLSDERLTIYGAWVEGNGHEKRDGLYIAVWGGGFENDESGEGWGPFTKMPDWWFKHDSEFEQPLAPTLWQPLPEPPCS